MNLPDEHTYSIPGADVDVYGVVIDSGLSDGESIEFDVNCVTKVEVG